MLDKRGIGKPSLLFIQEKSTNGIRKVSQRKSPLKCHFPAGRDIFFTATDSFDRVESEHFGDLKKLYNVDTALSAFESVLLIRLCTVSCT
jgi:hypothetical protein